MKTLKQVPANYKKLPDEELVFRYTDRHEQIAFSCLFNRYAHLVLGVCMHTLGGAHIAKKNTEDIFTRLTTELPRFNGENFKAWLFDLVNDHCKKPSSERMQVVDGYHSSCLTKKQMEHYVTGMMISEELNALETHAGNCSFCNHAVKGLKARDRNAEVLLSLNSDFLKEYFSLRFPHIHLNAIAMSKPVTTHHRHKSRKQTKHAWSPSAFAAIILLAGGIFWYTESGKNLLHAKDVAPVTEIPVPTKAIVQETKTEELKNVDVTPVGTTDHTVSTGKEPKQPEVSVAPAVTPKWENKKQEQKFIATHDATEEIPEPPAEKRSGIFGIFKHREIPEHEMSKGDEHFENGNYRAAANSYRNEMKTEDKTQRHEAGIMAAQSYINLGEKDKATRILQDIIDEGGAEKRAAKRLLSDINEEQ